MQRMLEGKVAIVTGGARGIGWAASRRLAAEGAVTLVADVLDEEGKAGAAEIVRGGGRAEYIHLDVSSEKEWQAAVERAARGHGGLHILVNNAGIARNEDIETETVEGYNRIIQVNQVGVWLGMKTAAPAIRSSGGGSIINISSIYGAIGGTGAAAAYHASKGAIRVMTKNAAIRYAKEGIRVNSVHPGFIDTAMVQPFLNRQDEVGERMRRFMETMTPMGRVGRPEEVAGIIAFLASEDASYMTGSEVFVDGGWMAM